MKKGFTLMEILTVVVIVAVLAAIALPRFLKAKQKITQRQAEGYLRAIRISQKMYYARYAGYGCQVGGGCTSANAIKTTLGTDLRDGTYTFSVASDTPISFIATAAGGPGGDITVDQDGNFKKAGVSYEPPA